MDKVLFFFFLELRALNYFFYLHFVFLFLIFFFFYLQTILLVFSWECRRCLAMFIKAMTDKSPKQKVTTDKKKDSNSCLSQRDSSFKERLTEWYKI